MRSPRILSRLGRRWIWVAIAAVVLMLVPATSVWAVLTFTDVPTTHTHYQGIQYLASANITTGYLDGTFRPDNTLTRGQMGTFLYRASGNDPATPPSVNADKVDGKDAGQLVAAGLHVSRGKFDLPLVRDWYNNVNGVAPTIRTPWEGFYVLDVGFATDGRIVVATVDYGSVGTRDAFATVYPPPNGNEVWVSIYDVSMGAAAPAEFYVMIF